jgi:hypothetical protein
VVNVTAQDFYVGQKVRVPWGRAPDVDGEVVEVWGRPAQHVRVKLALDEGTEPIIILLSPSVLRAA